MIAQLNTSIDTEIAYSYTDFDGTEVDVVLMTYPDGTVETRQCWTEETLDEPEYVVKTSNGSVVKSSYRNAWNNKWLTTYRQLWLRRAQQRAAVEKMLERLANPKEQEEIELDRAAELAKADLGFGW